MRPLHYLLITAVVIFFSCSHKENINAAASITTLDQLPENPLLLCPITFSINPKETSMSTLYGNKAAFEHASGNAGGPYPAGAVLYEVKWKQKADSLWFGANVPSHIIQVERILFTGEKLPKYELYGGSPLKKIIKHTDLSRVKAIISQHMAYNP
jgi:hypothetical protein